MVFTGSMKPYRFTVLALALLGACGTSPTMGTLSVVPPTSDRPSEERFTLAFGSCAHQDQPQPILNAVVAARPDVFVYMGDNVYADTRDVDELKATYQRLAARPEFQALRAAVPLYATWDDHDYGENDAGREYPMKVESAQIFLDFWGVPGDAPQRQSPGIYSEALFGEGERRIQLLLLDTRTFRGPLAPAGDDPRFKYRYRPDPTAKLLGEAQWTWLQERLAEPAAIRIIGSSIQFSADYTGFESWANLPSEHTRLLKLLEKAAPAPVIFISGDVHHGELSRFSPDNGAPLYDLTSSGLNQVGTILEPNTVRVGKAVQEANFGVVMIDWEAGTVGMSLRGITGATLLSETVSFKALQSEREKRPLATPPESGDDRDTSEESHRAP